jgi:hypothetical protein
MPIIDAIRMHPKNFLLAMGGVLLGKRLFLHLRDFHSGLHHSGAGHEQAGHIE